AKRSPSCMAAVSGRSPNRGWEAAFISPSAATCRLWLSPQRQPLFLLHRVRDRPGLILFVGGIGQRRIVRAVVVGRRAHDGTGVSRRHFGVAVGPAAADNRKASQHGGHRQDFFHTCRISIEVKKTMPTLNFAVKQGINGLYRLLQGTRRG